VHQEPSGFHAAIERPLHLSSADTLLALANDVDRLKPEMQRKMAILEDRADSHGEALPADVASAKSYAGRLALKASNPCRVNVAAMRANRAVRPQVRLYIRKGGFFVAEMGSGQDRLRFLWSDSVNPSMFCQVYNCRRPANEAFLYGWLANRCGKADEVEEVEDPRFSLTPNVTR